MNVDLTKVHNLSGPVAVEGAEPGDCLVVDILDGLSSITHSTAWTASHKYETAVQPFDKMPWGYTVCPPSCEGAA